MTTKSEVYLGTNVLKVVSEVSKFRIFYFKEFPYLYHGNLGYEEAYFREFSVDPLAYVDIVRSSSGELIGIGTGIPLKSSADILKDTETLFSEYGLVPSEYFYVGEIIIGHQFREKGLGRNILRRTENFAIRQGFGKTTFATVVRSPIDPRRPPNYVDPDSLWQAWGYSKSQLMFYYHWPTLMENGHIEDVENEMTFWMKDLKA